MSFLTRAILVAALTVLVSGEPAAGDWLTEVVRSAGDVGSWSSMAVYSPPDNQSSEWHISYYDARNGNLKHAKRISGQGWTSQTVTGKGDVGSNNALALRRGGYEGEPSIAYLDLTRGTISYAYLRDDGKWRIDALRRQFFATGGYDPSLVVDSTNHYHILHEDHTDLSQLRYLRSRNSGWASEFLGVQIQRRSSALAIAGDDTLHAVYLDFCAPPLFDCDHRGVAAWVVHASNTGVNGTWETENIVRVELEGIMSSSIGVDAQGAVHIVYVDRYDVTLNHLTNASGLWKPRVLDNQSGVSGASMKVDVRGDLHVSYTAGGGPNGRTLKYATNSSGVWVHEVVDDARNIGDVTSIAIDRFGQPHISYYDATRGDLRHALRQ